MKRITTLLLAIAGCDLSDEPDDILCDQVASTSVIVTPSGAPTFEVGAESVKLRGTASHALGLTIRRITVAGLDAKAESFNFAAWSIDLPADVVTAELAADATLPTDVTLDVAAYDACRGEITAATATVSIDIVEPEQ